MKPYSVYWERILLFGYFCRMSGSAPGGGLPVAHVNGPAVYPVPLPSAASMHECPHQAAVRGSSAAPTWSVPPSLARRAPVWPQAPPGHGIGAPGGACGGDRSAARACAPGLGCWLVGAGPWILPLLCLPHGLGSAPLPPLVIAFIVWRKQGCSLFQRETLPHPQGCLMRAQLWEASYVKSG